jgi:dipeptidyl aminopeptidase/acylaminoacyl peptidase
MACSTIYGRRSDEAKTQLSNHKPQNVVDLKLLFRQSDGSSYFHNLEGLALHPIQLSVRPAIALLLAALCCASMPARAQAPAATPAPIASFFQRPAFNDAVLSPNGKNLATRIVDKNGHDVLAVIDLESRAAKIVAGYTDDDVSSFQWVNDERLVYTLNNKQEATGDTWQAPGLFAINRDGSRPVQLAERDAYFMRESTHIKRNILPWHTYLIAPGAQDSEFIYVRSDQYQFNGRGKSIDSVNLLRVNTLTGASQVVNRPGRTQGWLLDHQGQPRLAVTLEREMATVHYLDPATGQWRAVASFDAYIGGNDAFEPLGFGPDGTLYVTKTRNSDTSSLHRFNFATGKVDPEALMAAPGYDFHGELIRNRTKLLGAELVTDRRAAVWFDGAMQAMQTAIDKAMPATTNLLTVPADPAAPNVLIESYSDKIPPRYALFNKKTGELSQIGDSHANIDSARMGSQTMVSYKARDGLAIPALLTLPPGGAGKNLPMVVLVHGGPWTRGATWAWNPQSQFLASRGYAVLEPHFRGTMGLGYKHFAASFKQWGLAMQNDLADGTRWAVAQGYADANRVCIAGASYGGYAVLMGLVNDPALYKCGVEWAGVTDINLMYTDTAFSESDASAEWKKFGMPRLIGDQVKDAAQLKATSPIEQAGRITQPLLLAYGGADRRVPMAQGRLFYDKVKKTNPRVQWIQYDGEGHGWYLPATRIDFWSKVEKFLATHIGQP